MRTFLHQSVAVKFASFARGAGSGMIDCRMRGDGLEGVAGNLVTFRPGGHHGFCFTTHASQRASEQRA